MTEMERSLYVLAREVDWPETPDLAQGVVDRLDEGARGPRRGVRRVALLVALLVLLPAASVLGVSSDARDAVLEWVGLRGARVEKVRTLPPVPAGAGLRLGRAVTLDQATVLLDVPLAVPGALGAPDGVYLAEDAAGRRVTLVYRPRPGLPEARETGVGLLVTVLRGRTDPIVLKKAAGGGTRVTALHVGGDPAIALDGGGHQVVYLDSSGRQVAETLRLSANALLIEHGDALIRLEAALPARRLVAVAETLREPASPG